MGSFQNVECHALCREYSEYIKGNNCKLSQDVEPNPKLPRRSHHSASIGAGHELSSLPTYEAPNTVAICLREEYPRFQVLIPGVTGSPE